ncbi:uncharacterized protein KY384_008722 [Bacidia gigantensis]|uniref:uncharacterized protein n=1 Tax=Bacidia gigantensis TaxID=2732470 RepID=UPI001D040B90|nr:uncharacterized protein KY384_008722 [Bacidia gigantensis]KAG8526522.1 hypothetical protein KY384_008722 [Bacidia gigantensis]
MDLFGLDVSQRILIMLYAVNFCFLRIGDLETVERFHAILSTVQFVVSLKHLKMIQFVLCTLILLMLIIRRDSAAPVDTPTPASGPLVLDGANEFGFSNDSIVPGQTKCYSPDDTIFTKPQTAGNFNYDSCFTQIEEVTGYFRRVSDEPISFWYTGGATKPNEAVEPAVKLPAIRSSGCSIVVASTKLLSDVSTAGRPGQGSIGWRPEWGNRDRRSPEGANKVNRLKRADIINGLDWLLIECVAATGGAGHMKFGTSPCFPPLTSGTEGLTIHVKRR